MFLHSPNICMSFTRKQLRCILPICFANCESMCPDGHNFLWNQMNGNPAQISCTQSMRIPGFLLKLHYSILLCAVFQGGGTAHLLTPGTGISKPLPVKKRHDTDGRRRQLTKLPRPCPQHPPFTLRYGNLWFPHSGGSWQSGHDQCPLQTFRGIARAFDVILFYGVQESSADSHRARV